MNSIQRIRQLSGNGIDIGGSEPRPAAPSPSGSMHNSIQQDFQQFTAPQAQPMQPMLPSDDALNTPIAYNPISGAGYAAAPKRRR